MTQPVKDELRIKDLETIRDVFQRHGVRFFVCYGALLGMYRDGKLIPQDDDIDLSVIDIVSLETKKKIGWALYDLGFSPQPVAFNVFGRMENGEPGYNGDDKTGIIVCERNFKFTIFFFQTEECDMHGFEYVCIPKVGAVKLISTPCRFFQTPGSIKIGKYKYLTPAPIEDYLGFSYKNWKNREDTDHSPTYPLAHQK